MISITVCKDKTKGYRELHCEGHALFGYRGSDVVCAAVSVLVINTINGIEQFTEDAFTLDTWSEDETDSSRKPFGRKGGRKDRRQEEQNHIDVKFTEPVSERTTLLMDVLMQGLTEIQSEYGESYVTVTIKEV